MINKILSRATAETGVEGLLFELSQLEADSRTIAAARERGARQRGDIIERRRKLIEDGPDAEAAAAALLEDEPINARLASVDQLSRELESVQAALGALQRREDEIQRQRGEVRERLAAVSAGRLQSLIDEMRSRAADMFAYLAETYAGAEAIREATHALAATELAHQLRPVLARTHVSRLVAASPIAPPPSVTQALRDQGELIRMSGGRVVDAVPFPLAEPL